MTHMDCTPFLTASSLGLGRVGRLGIGSPMGPEICEGSGSCSSRPVRVAGGVRFRQVSVGSGHTRGVTAVGVAYCWGLNGAGQLGNGRASGPEICDEFFACSHRPV